MLNIMLAGLFTKHALHELSMFRYVWANECGEKTLCDVERKHQNGGENILK